MNKFRKGTIAVCQHGHIGLITFDEKFDCGLEKAYLGIHIAPERIGQPWQSQNPKFVCHVDDLMKRFDGTTFFVEPEVPQVSNSIEKMELELQDLNRRINRCYDGPMVDVLMAEKHGLEHRIEACRKQLTNPPERNP
jgi:hypothetical protein